MYNLFRQYLSFCLLGCLIFSASASSQQKPKNYQEEVDYSSWLMSEKLDGIRAIWDGNHLTTRKAKTIFAPKWFIKQLPPFSLDGELWTKRQDFENIQSIVMDQSPSKHWKKVYYHIFEVPQAKGNFHQRLEKLVEWKKTHPSKNLKIIPQIKVKNNRHIDQYFNQLIKKGAEGIIVKNPEPEYFTGRSSHIVKRKATDDMEAVVIKINPGKGKYKNKMGSITLKLLNGLVFKLGSGFSDEQRIQPPKIGDLVKFKYYGFTKNGIPKHASFIAIRKD